MLARGLVMPTTPRRCSTCRHFQPAPLWRKGWCRHPLLYAPHQNHLVDERELDCHRQFGDYWEPVEAEAKAEPVSPPAATAVPPAVAVATSPSSEPGSAAVSVAASQGGTPPAGAAPAPAVDTGQTPPPPRSDRLRLLVPAVIIGGLALGYLLWSGILMQTTGEVPTPTAIPATAPVVSTPAAMATAAPPTVAPTSPPTPRPTTPPTAPPTVATTPTRVATPGIRAGAAALVDTGSNDGLRLRREPGSAGVVLRSIRNGERVSVLDGPRDADGITWWRVAYAGDEGWVAGQYLKPPP
jgi:hypothetical protein